MRKVQWTKGNKAYLITLLCANDADFKFEFAVRGVREIMKAYTYRQLKQKMQAITDTP